MLQVHDGQCGLCLHFGEHHAEKKEIVQVRVKHVAPDSMVDECGHPKHAPLHLMVTPISKCDGFAPAKMN